MRGDALEARNGVSAGEGGQRLNFPNIFLLGFVGDSVLWNIIYHGFWWLILIFLLPQICFDRPSEHKSVLVAEMKIQEREK